MVPSGSTWQSGRVGKSHQRQEQRALSGVLGRAQQNVIHRRLRRCVANNDIQKCSRSDDAWTSPHSEDRTMRSAALRLVENDPPTILSVATAVPRFRLDQADVARAAMHVFDRERSDIERLMPVFDNAGILTRHSSVPIEWYFETHGWRE